MNKYVVRTSFVWLGILVIALAGMFLYLTHKTPASQKTTPPTSTEVQPVAEGPATASATQSTSMHGSAKSSTGATSQSGLQSPLTPIQLSPQRMQSIGVQVGKVEYKNLNNDVRATGNVDIDQRLISYVQVRFPGYIRQVFANAIYQYVRKGEPLFTVYSPDLVATEQEYLLAKQDQKLMGSSRVNGVAAGADSLTAAAEQRLQQWEIPQNELQKLKSTGKPITDLTINSPVSGYITEYNALPNMYVEPSTRLYTVADLSRVWVYAQVFQDDVGRLKPGDPVEIAVDAYPGRIFYGRVDQILPQVDLATRTVPVRVIVQNPGIILKPGMYVNCDLKAPLGRQLAVPSTAVFQTGTRSLVFLYKGRGYLEPKQVTLGPEAGNYYAVLKGLKPHQRIVTSANFLIDSESQLQSAAGSFAPPPPVAGNNSSSSNASVTAKLDFTTNPNPPQKGRNVFRVRLTDAKGTAISGAQVTVRFYMAAMPAMGMAAMKTSTVLNDKGNGIYEATGSLGSGGTWQTTVVAQKNGQTVATKQLSLTTTGGM
jgi:Cu(I)/Ag(I) efflux system membrane fusion protein/cobalt-zinc-cadmium efflux system membrane fusion protein